MRRAKVAIRSSASKPASSIEAMLNARVASRIRSNGGIRPSGSTCLIFYDYMSPALGLSALLNLPWVFIFSHDSIGLGEDGPTHQPVEQLMCLRAIPGLTVLRPADANETAAAWKVAWCAR